MAEASTLERLLQNARDELSALIELRCRLGEDPWVFLPDLPSVDEQVVATLREERLGPVTMPGIAEDLKLLVDARDQLIMERTRVANRLHAHLVLLAPGYRQTVRGELTEPTQVAAATKLLRRAVGIRCDLPNQ